MELVLSRCLDCGEGTVSVLRGGMTLIELLVVLTIILVVAAATIPRLRPELDRSRVREAARSIQLYLSSARVQAMTNGRSCGVQIERLPAENGCSMQLTQVETPPMYGGDSMNSIAKVTPAPPPSGSNAHAYPGYAYCTVTLSPPPSVPLFALDQIQVGYQGFWITIDPSNTTSGPNSAIANPGRILGYVDTNHGEVPPWTAQPTTGISGAFNIKRWPVKSQAATLQLPSPACIDLTLSGIDPVTTQDTPTWLVASDPITIMFASDGSVDKVYRTVQSTTTNQRFYNETRVTSTIYLLVGTRENVVDPPYNNNGSTNLANISNLWVAINASTGLIVVTDMAVTNASPSLPLTAAQYAGSPLYVSRTFARESDPIGGK
jgi:prepilin-type N-terminal cleavage/methylation domain-containing protein